MLKKYRELFLVAGLILVALLTKFLSPEVENVVFHFRDEVKESQLPISLPMQDGEPFSVELDFSTFFNEDFELVIHPDDCVTGMTVNGISFPFRQYPGYCSWGTGFVVKKEDIQKVLGSNVSKYHMSMSLHNNGGLGGLTLALESSGIFARIMTVVFFGLLAALIFSIGGRLRFDRRLLLIFFLGLLLRAGYTQETFYDQRGHDTNGHVRYMEIIAQENRIPDSHECWSCYHPPVYYVASAGVWKVCDLVGVPPYNAMMWFDFAISLLALAFGLFCIKDISWSAPRYIAALLWSVWPSFILASPRLGNDIMFYMMHVIALWACIRYIKANSAKYFILAVVAAFGAYWTKNTGAITFGLVGVTALIHLIPKFFWKWNKWDLASLITLVVVGGVVVFRVLFGNIVGNVGGLDDTVLVRNDPGNFLFFDIRSFIVNPYIDPWHDELGRQFFWNYLAKTSLFGEFELLRTVPGLWLASFISVSFLVLLGFGVYGFAKSAWNKTKVLLTAQAVFFFAAMIALRLKYPYSCSNDFRYIVPVLLSCVPWVGEGIAGNYTVAKAKVCGIAAVAVFVVCTALLIVSL